MDERLIYSHLGKLYFHLYFLKSTALSIRPTNYMFDCSIISRAWPKTIKMGFFLPFTDWRPKPYRNLPRFARKILSRTHPRTAGTLPIHLYYQVGNPHLRPELAHNIDLSHTFADKLVTTLSYSHLNDVLSSTFVTHPGSLVLEESYTNASIRNSFGLSVDYSEEIASWYSFSVSTILINKHFKGHWPMKQLISGRLIGWPARKPIQLCQNMEGRIVSKLSVCFTRRSHIGIAWNGLCKPNGRQTHTQ